MLNWQLSPILILLFVGALVLAAVCVVALRRRATPGALPLALLALALCIYNLGYAGEISSTTSAAVLTWLKIEYVGIVALVPLIFLTVLDFSGGRRWLSPLTVALLFAVPTVTLLLAWTAEYHDWIWQDLHLEPVGGFYLAEFEAGGWYRLDSAYRIGLLLTTVGLLVATWRRATDPIYRRQLVALLVGILVPVGVYFFYLSNITETLMDINPFAGSIGAVIIAWGLLKQRLFDVAPVARETLLANMRELVIVADAQDRVVEMNDAARAALGVTEPEVAGQPVTQVCATWPALVDVYRRVDDGSVEIERNGAGPRRIYDMRLTPLRDRAGQRRGRLAILSDITARVTAEEALRTSYERLLMLRDIDVALGQRLDAAYVAGVTVQAAAAISQARAVVLLRWLDDDLWVMGAVGDFPAERVGTRVALNGGALLAAWQTRQFTAATAPDVTPDALLVPGTQTQLVAPLLSGETRIGLLVLESDGHDDATTQDIEMLRLLAARAAVAIDNAVMYEDRAQLVSELEAFAHTVAHDLKNPLSYIITTAALMRDEALDDETRARLVGSIVQTGYKGVDIINALLLLAKVQRVEDVVRSALDMEPIVHDVLTRLTADIEARATQIILPQRWETAFGYGPWVEEIWANYISNAIKYGGDPPIVTLGSERMVDGSVCFWVADNGRGLTPEQQAQLFQPFNRLQQRIEGHGLGLSIARRIADRLNGTVGVDSVPGEGSRFYFTLPPVA